METEMNTLDTEDTQDATSGSDASPRDVDPVRLRADFALFEGLVAMYTTTLAHASGELARRWLLDMASRLIHHVTVCPSLSGLLRMLAASVAAAARADYFHGTARTTLASPTGEREVAAFRNDDDDSTRDAAGDGARWGGVLLDDDGDIVTSTYSNTDVPHADRMRCVVLLTKFVGELLGRIWEYKDELLQTALHLLLSLPLPVVVEWTQPLARAMAMAFTMGLGHLETAQRALDTLAVWVECMDRARLDVVLPLVLPKVRCACVAWRLFFIVLFSFFGLVHS